MKQDQFNIRPNLLGSAAIGIYVTRNTQTHHSHLTLTFKQNTTENSLQPYNIESDKKKYEEEAKSEVYQNNVSFMEVGLNLKETELCLGLPGGGAEFDLVKVTGKRGFSETVDLKLKLQSNDSGELDLKESLKNSATEKDGNPTKDMAKPPAKSQMVGWPPVRSFRKNIIAHQKIAAADEAEKSSSVGGAAFVKVSMDGAPYLRKVDLKTYRSYQQLSDALAKMFSSFTMGSYGPQGMIDFMNESKLMDLLNSSEYVPTYEDKDGDWMLVGDVPWEMFVGSCKRLRIMKGSEAIGLAPRAMEKCKSRC